MPKVTIIVPVYKVEAYLKRCVDSILHQTFRDFQLILVDDGSPDQCPAICDQYAKQDTRIQVIHKENGGLTSARLAGFQMAQGDFISFIDSDDYINNCMIEKLYSACLRDDSDLAICGYYTVINNKFVPNELPFDKKIIHRDEVNDNFVLPIIGRIFSKGYINLPGFLWMRLFRVRILTSDCFVSEREYFTEDDLLNLIIAPKCQKISIINEPLYYYWQNTQSLTNRYRENTWDLLLRRQTFCVEYCQKNGLIDKAKDRLDFNLLGVIYFSIENSCKIKDNEELSVHEIRSILDHPETIRVLNKINIYLMTRPQMLLYFMCKFKMHRLLYRYKKFRMSRWINA